MKMILCCIDWNALTAIGTFLLALATFISIWQMRKQREEYHGSIKELYGMIATMKTAGADVKDIAIAVSTRRNEIRLESYKNDPVGLAKVKKSNLENYGNENGGTPEYYYNKYGSWETVA